MDYVSQHETFKIPQWKMFLEITPVKLASTEKRTRRHGEEKSMHLRQFWDQVLSLFVGLDLSEAQFPHL